MNKTSIRELGMLFTRTESRVLKQRVAEQPQIPPRDPQSHPDFAVSSSLT